jgi:drug/metabolite transporter (DMT)-like permease
MPDSQVIEARRTTTLGRRPTRPGRFPVLPLSVSGSDLGAIAMWMSGVLVSFTVVALSVRTLQTNLSVFDMMTVRSAVGSVIMLAILAASPALRRDLSLKHIKLHLLRSSLHFASQIGWAISVTLLPLATVFALEFTMPAWVAIFAVFLLGEKMTPVRVMSIALCFAGVLVIVHPGLDSFRPAVLIILATALVFALVGITTKKLTATESTFTILFWMNLMQLPMNFAGSDPGFVFRIDAWMIVPLLGVALGGLTTHLCLTNALRHGEAMIVVPLDFLRVPFIALVGAVLYGEPIDALTLGGAGLIIAGVAWNLRDGRARVRPGSPVDSAREAATRGTRPNVIACKVTGTGRMQLAADPDYERED